MGRKSFSRSDRLSTTIKREIAEMIQNKSIKELKDSRLNGLISITDVRVMNGYQHLDVYLSILEKENQKPVMEVLNEAISSIRGAICRRLKLRIAPTLQFHLDNSLERSENILNLLDKLAQNGE